MHVKQSCAVLAMISALAMIPAPFARAAGGGAGTGTGTGALTLAAPAGLRAVGVLKYLLPRFRFKKQISVVVVGDGTEGRTGDGARNAPKNATSDMALSPGGPGRVVFLTRKGGAAWHLRLPPKGAPARARAQVFQDWLLSKPGRAAITTFPPGRPALFDAPPERVAVVVAPKLNGNAERGHLLARRDCMRCHVVDAQNPFAGIGSTPSFAALRTYPDWRARFEQFWDVNPHRALITVTGRSAGKTPPQPVTFAPITLMIKDLDDLVAYVAGIKPKDLGAPLAGD